MPRSLDHSQRWFRKKSYSPSESRMAAFDRMVEIQQEAEADRLFWAAQETEIDGPPIACELPFSEQTSSEPLRKLDLPQSANDLNPDIPHRHGVEG